MPDPATRSNRRIWEGLRSCTTPRQFGYLGAPALAVIGCFHRWVLVFRLSFIADELLAHRHVRYACIIEHHSFFYVPKSFVKFARYELRAENDFVGAFAGGSGRGELHQLLPIPFFRDEADTAILPTFAVRSWCTMRSVPMT